MSAVLVTGGAGYVGSHVVRRLREAGREVVVVDDLSQGHRDAVGDTPLIEADFYTHYASLALARGDNKTAGDYHMRALEIREAKLGADHPEVAISLTNIANAFTGLGEHQKAEQLARRVAEQARGSAIASCGICSARACCCMSSISHPPIQRPTRLRTRARSRASSRSTTRISLRSRAGSSSTSSISFLRKSATRA